MVGVIVVSALAMLGRKTASTPVLGRSPGLIASALLWGFLEMVVLSLTAYVSVEYSSGLAAMGLWLVIGLAGFAGYFMGDTRRGISALLLSETVAFPLASSALLLVPSPAAGPFGALDPRVLGQSGLAPVFVAGLVILLFFLGMIAVMLGSLLRQARDPPVMVVGDWRLVAFGIMLNSIAAFWVVSPTALPPQPVGWYPVLNAWGFPVTASLVAVGILLIVFGLFSRSTSSTATMGLMSIGSFVAGALLLVPLTYAVNVVSVARSQLDNCSSCPSTPFFSQEYQSFLIVALPLAASLVACAIVFLSVTFLLRKKTLA